MPNTGYFQCPPHIHCGVYRLSGLIKEIIALIVALVDTKQTIMYNLGVDVCLF